ncbi:hypothetical protein [Larkinella soli]|uniref:hypothetical protein n=1 Tax=Larkinella soli TaxID=1770527 RepID=UPI000FFC9363|nr:hypothetical protein [Larkinella soli]
MKKNAYQYLFAEDALFQVPEPEPVHRAVVAEKSPEPVPVLIPEPEEIQERPVAELLPEPDLPEEPVELVLLDDPEPEPVALITEPVEMPPVGTGSNEPVSVTPEPAAPPTVKTPPTEPKQKVLILIDEELQPSEQIFLDKVLKAIHLSLEEVDLMNLAGSGLMDFHAVFENKSIHHFISFGVPFKTVHLDIHLNRYEPLRLFGITFLLADPLSALEADQKLKRKLWLVLQKLFLNP